MSGRLPIPPSHIASRCYDDVLSYIFTFLTLRQRGKLCLVSTAWNRVALKGRSFDNAALRVNCRDLSRLASARILQRHLHHVYMRPLDTTHRMTFDEMIVELGHLDAFQHLHKLSFSFMAGGIDLDSPQVISILNRLTQLRHLQFPYFESGSWDGLLQPECTLVHLQDMGDTQYTSDRLMRAQQYLPNLTTLYMRFDFSWLPRFELFRTPLQMMRMTNTNRKSEHRLTSIDMAALDVSHLQTVGLYQILLDESMVAWLASIPNLTCLRVHHKTYIPSFRAFAHPHLQEFEAGAHHDFLYDSLPQLANNPCLRHNELLWF